jgi:hypothetical protein
MTVLVIAAGTMIGGSMLRSLVTGIDHQVWPFYRRQEYRDALSRYFRG